MKSPTERIEASLYREGAVSHVLEPVIREESVEVFLNDRKVATIACTGIHLDELAVGFLRSIGALRVLEDIEAITVSPEGSRVDVRTTDATQSRQSPSELLVLSSGTQTGGSGTGRGPITSDISISAKTAIALMEELLTSSELHEMTHGTHCSALADTERIIVSRDDIGRHNTIDMLGGYALLGGIDCSDKIIVKTGRVSSEIAQKAWTLGVPIMISHSVPTSEAVGILRDAGITLIGHVRNNTCKVYTNERRVRF
ncbi:MAG: formate dehydrogenase accessory sulfurtransferase FdhD [Deltaproteobacteria bacterium]|nr:formate dehydrogenase accessory sulfurtransferase FdhD [Deltaproteobacteria bacterium]